MTEQSDAKTSIEVTNVQLSSFKDVFGQLTELSSLAIGGRVSSVSDDFFAEASSLILVEQAVSMKGQFGPKGALFSGWESRRHNPAYDWCIIKLGTTGTINGFDIDTSHFNGNEAPEADVQILFDNTPNFEPNSKDPRWTQVLPKVPLGPSQHHLFSIPTTSKANWVKLNMYPDGGIARFRVYGHVQPVYPDDPTETFDLAHVFSGGQVIAVSDQHFGVGSNLIIPGRGKDMGDGWETKRSRAVGHNDWAIIRLGSLAYLQYAEIDTAHFMGNFPQRVTLHGLNSPSLSPSDVNDLKPEAWTQILPPVKTGPHRQHYFALENVQDAAYTHVKLTIYPDGGLKRVRLFGTRADLPNATSLVAGNGLPDGLHKALPSLPETTPLGSLKLKQPRRIIPILPLTPEAFSAFGQVIQAYADDNAAPLPTKITPANQGTARKYHKLSLFESSYSEGSSASTGVSVYRCSPLPDSAQHSWPVEYLERHAHTKQTFIPMGSSTIEGGADGLHDPGNSYLVVVASNAPDGRPDLSSLKAFVATASQGICYDTAIWHQPMAVFGKDMDFACFEAQIGDGSLEDCEILQIPEEDVVVVKKYI